MAQEDRSPRRARTRLSRERVLHAAVELADESGIESVTMRTLARRLGVEAMSLYNHVANKEDILDGIVEVVIAEIELPAEGERWKPAMRRRAISTRAMCSRHPWAIVLMQSRSTVGPAAMRYYDEVIGCMRNAGFSISMTAHAFSAIDSYVFGFALQEQNLPFETQEDVSAIAGNIFEGFPVEEYPHFTEFITEHALQPGYDYGEEFEYGLDVVLDGLERALDLP